MSITPAKPDFRTVMETMHKLLRGEMPPAEAARILGAPVERVAIYQHFVRSHISNALLKNYEVLADLLPDAEWEALVESYFKAYPALEFELNANARQFCAYLAEVGHDVGPFLTEFHREVAQLEWSEWLVYSTREEIPSFSEVTEPILNPTLIILEFTHPVGSFVDAWRQAKRHGDSRPSIPGSEQQRVFVLREPTSLLAMFLPASDRHLFAFKMVHEGVSIPDAAQMAGADEATVRSILTDAADAGLVILPEDF
jgi:DNA-directed RNA polymerase specialized sigma24 family protein